ncbi:MAG: prepilin peptidase [Pseudomonadota bacterium]
MTALPVRIAFVDRVQEAPEAATAIAGVLLLVVALGGPLPQAVRAGIRVVWPNLPSVRRRSVEPLTRLALQIGLASGGALAWLVAGGAGAMAAALLACCAVLLVCDLRWRWLPIEWTGALLVSGLALAAMAGQGTQALVDAAVIAASLLAVRAGYRSLRGVDGLGLGDVILAAGITAHLGLALGGLVLLAATLAALACHALGQPSPIATDAKPRTVPLGAYLAGAFALVPSFSILL